MTGVLHRGHRRKVLESSTEFVERREGYPWLEKRDSGPVPLLHHLFHCLMRKYHTMSTNISMAEGTENNSLFLFGGQATDQSTTLFQGASIY